MPSTIGKCKLFRIKHITLLEGETFLKNTHKIAFFEKSAHFLVEKKTPLDGEISGSMKILFLHISSSGQMSLFINRP